MFKSFTRVLITASASLACSVALAQQAVIEEITVTAQKRDQVAQDIPISIFAITEDALERAGINSLEGMRDITAGLEIVSSSPGSLQIAMRGVTNLSGTIESTAAIGSCRCRERRNFVISASAIAAI